MRIQGNFFFVFTEKLVIAAIESKSDSLEFPGENWSMVSSVAPSGTSSEGIQSLSTIKYPLRKLTSAQYADVPYYTGYESTDVYPWLALNNKSASTPSGYGNWTPPLRNWCIDANPGRSVGLQYVVPKTGTAFVDLEFSKASQHQNGKAIVVLLVQRKGQFATHQLSSYIHTLTPTRKQLKIELSAGDQLFIGLTNPKGNDDDREQNAVCFTRLRIEQRSAQAEEAGIEAVQLTFKADPEL